ncbi:MAG: hypothetical protein ACI4FY_05405 [Acetatifactor sp.]
MNVSDRSRNASMLTGSLAKKGYMRFFHSFHGIQEETCAVRSFFIEFLIVNPAYSYDRPVLAHYPFNRKLGLQPSYVCVKAGIYPDANGEGGLELSRYYPISSLRTTPSPLVMQVGECFYSEERLSGHLTVTEDTARHKYNLTDAGEMTWNLDLQKTVSCHTGILASPLFQWLRALDSYWHGEGIKTFFRGQVTVNGISYRIQADTSFGYADKHWGRSINEPLFRLSCSRLTSEKTGQVLRHSALAVDGCCPRFFFLPLNKKLLLQLTYTGEDFNFGFSPFALSRCLWETKSTKKRSIWHLKAQNKNTIIKIQAACPKAQQLRFRYESPDGVIDKDPILSGAGVIGTIRLYRRLPGGGRELIDTLRMEQGFCEYQNK